MTPADELRKAANTLEATPKCDGTLTDCWCPESDQLIDNLRRAATVWDRHAMVATGLLEDARKINALEN